jgi:hypothetical protein
VLVAVTLQRQKTGLYAQADANNHSLQTEVEFALACNCWHDVHVGYLQDLPSSASEFAGKLGVDASSRSSSSECSVLSI